MVCSDTAASHSIITIKQDEDKLVPIDKHKLFGIAGEAGDRVNFTEFIIANVKLYELRNSAQLSTSAVAHLTRGELAKALRQVGLAGRRRAGQGRAAAGHARSWGQLGQPGSWYMGATGRARAHAPPPSMRARTAHVRSRVQSPYHCNLLLAGYDAKEGPSLYWMDYLATLNKINTGGTGYGARPAHKAPAACMHAHGPHGRTAGCCSLSGVLAWGACGALGVGGKLRALASRPAGAMFVLSLFDKLWHPNLTEAEALDMMEQVRGCLGARWHWSSGRLCAARAPHCLHHAAATMLNWSRGRALLR